MTAERRIASSSATAAPPASNDDHSNYSNDNNIMVEENSNRNDNDHGRRRRRLHHVLSLMASPLIDDAGDLKSVLVGLCTLFVVGASIGLVTPKNPTLPSPWYRNISASIGYIYFLAWSISFYPQVISNFKRRCTTGLSPDFCVLNVLGFACYTAYNVSFFWSTTIQDMYRKRHGPDAEITVQSNDVAFAIHALILSSVTVLQIAYYGGGMRALKLSKPIFIVIGGILSICAIYPVLIWITRQYHNIDKDTFNWLDFLYVLSFVKIGISLIKYIPQVILNFRRKSTVGWSIWNILLDFTGGCLSDLQLVLDCADTKDFSGITGNPAKFGLGFVSIIFDVIFMVQHYCLYSEPSDSTRNEQEEPLLPAVDSTAQTRETTVQGPTSSDQEPEMIMV
jgi:cystinosin